MTEPERTPSPEKTPGIPRPPSREELEEISDAQSLITDDWTGEGGGPRDEGKAGKR
jgi:hypothetical protein